MLRIMANRVDRGEILVRGATLRCPNCGGYGLFRNWFKLHKACRLCGMTLEKEQGFYLGTTSIGYVLAIIFVLIPVCVLVVTDVLSLWVGVSVGIIGTIVFTVALYPCLLGWVIMLYFAILPQELPANQPQDKASATDT